MVTIIGYTIFTALSAFSPNVFVFAVFQLLARVFLIGEWAVSMVIAAEEFPAERRGMVIGVIGAAATLGHVVCTGIVPGLVAAAGWRSVYLVGVIPLVIIAFARRNLRETAYFSAQDAATAKPSLLDIWRTPFRRRVVELSAIWLLTYIATQNAVFFWKDYAMTEAGLSEGTASSAQVIAALIAMPLAFAAGKLLDVIGRKPGAAVILLATAAGVAGAYTAKPFWLLVVFLTMAIVGITAALTVLNTFTTELFPTKLRGSAFAWSNNLLGRIGYWGSPLVIAPLVRDTGWAPTLRVTAIFPVLALILVLVLLPETRGKKLEETAVA
jgi:putative MFS transporter